MVNRTTLVVTLIYVIMMVSIPQTGQFIFIWNLYCNKSMDDVSNLLTFPSTKVMQDKLQY